MTPGADATGLAVKVFNRRLEAVALDELHGVIGTAAGLGPQSIHRDDAGVLQPAGDLCFDQEPTAADQIVGALVEDLLESDLAVQLAIERHEHRPQPAAGVEPSNVSLSFVSATASSGQIAMNRPSR
jgi:hypothetical protein